MQYLLVAVLWMGAPVWGQEQAKTTYQIARSDAVLRQGPGSYFPVLAELPLGTLVQATGEEKGWYRVVAGERHGYVSKRATEARAQRRDIMARMGEQKPVAKVSQHGVSAGIKGFAEKVLPHLGGGTEAVPTLLNYRMDPVAYHRFRAATQAPLEQASLQRRLPLPPSQGDVFFTFSEQGTGLAVAARIAAAGLWDKPDLQAYVNYVGQLVVEAGEAYDTGFKFFVLDDDSFNALACPGGWIFVTRGLLQELRSEAELAGVLGHEIAHVARYHGMVEMEKRKIRVLAEEAFAELAAEVEPASAERLAMEGELEQLGLAIYERLVAGRLAEYEEEADGLGLLYAARAGYDPLAMLGLLQRRGRVALGPNPHYNPAQIGPRLERLQQVVQQWNLPAGLLVRQQRYAAQLQAAGL